MDLSQLLESIINVDTVNGISATTNTSAEDVTNVLAASLPSLLNGAKAQADDAKTSESFLNAMLQHGTDDTSDVKEFMNKVDLEDGGKIVNHLLSDKVDDTAANVSRVTGVSTVQILKILAGRPEGFLVLSGNDDETFPLMKEGADGVISVASNIAPVPVAKLTHAMLEGKIEKAAGLHEKLSPLFRNCFVESNPIPTKAALNAMGMMANELRLPLVPAQQKTYDLMVSTVKDLGLL